MDRNQRGILTLFQSALEGRPLPLPTDFDMAEAYPILKKQHMIPLAYEGAVLCGADKTEPVMQKMLQFCFRNLLHSEGQMAALSALLAAFEAQGIEHLVLKGSTIGALYPKRELRPMGDADILIREGQYESIRKIMGSLGYEEGIVGSYAYTWTSGSLHVELHRKLAGAQDRLYSRYFGNGWKNAHRTAADSMRFAYSAEDQLIYLFMHFSKHYRDKGIGLRHAIDLWVFRKANPGLDRAYLQAELEKVQLWAFYQNICRMLEVWFGGAEEDAKSAFITDYIFDSGTFGRVEIYAASAAAKELTHTATAAQVRQKRFWKMLFPDPETMKNRYAAVRRYPVLLPLFWPIRWISALFFRRENIRRSKDILQMTSADRIETYMDAMQYVGLVLDSEEE